MKLHYPRLVFAVFALLLAGTAMHFARTDVGADMTQAANRFLDGLSEEQRDAATMEYANPERLDWHFIPKDHRKGLMIRDMDEETRKRALNLLRSGLSQIGYNKATVIMNLERILHELQERHGQQGPIRDSDRYYVTIFGTPSDSGTWGWSLEGHHLSLNFVVDDGKVAAHTPAFFGANPGTVKSITSVGPRHGFRTLADEEQLAFDLLHTLSDEQLATALISEEPLRDVRSAGEAGPPNTPPAGIPASELSAEQVTLLKSLLAAYNDNMPGEIAEKEMAEIREQGIEHVHFAWAGAQQPGVGHYYRVQGPSFLLEFANTQPDGDGNPANHIHALWRSAQGDFGLHLD